MDLTTISVERPLENNSNKKKDLFKKNCGWNKITTGVVFAVGFFAYVCIYIMTLKVSTKQGHQSHTATNHPLNSGKWPTFFFNCHYIDSRTSWFPDILSTLFWFCFERQF